MFKQYIRNINYKILFLICILFFFSIFMILSATGGDTSNLNFYITKQAISFFLGIIVMLLMLFVDYEALGVFYWWIYVFGIFLLLLVYIPGLGITLNSARSWIDLGFINLQTSELSKLCFIVALAKYLSAEERELNSVIDMIIPCLMLIPFLILLLLQPDLGTAIVFVTIFIGMIYVSGINIKLFSFGMLAVSVLLSIVYKLRLLKVHQLERIDAYLNPEDLSLPGNYQIMQSKITIGSGKFFGKGIFKGIYHKYDYLPVRESDFIYAVIGEETGFAGTIIILIIYIALIFQLIKMAIQAKDKFGGLIIFGVTFMFIYQIYQNIGMTIGLMPITGITLPFLSYGGSSLVTNFIAVGLVFSVYIRSMRRSEMN